VTFRLGRPKTTVRWRLTLIYGALFLLSGAALLAITYTLVEHATVTGSTARQAFIRSPPPNLLLRKGLPDNAQYIVRGQPLTPAQALRVKRLLRTETGKAVVRIAGSGQRISDLHQLVIESAIALAIMAVISTFLGWLVAGRVLRPLRTMTATTREISEENLHERLAMEGPHDELRHLADTIDGLLERLEGAFDAQRRFVANASHELRTPLTTTRALLEMVLTDPRATVQSFRITCQHVLEESEQQEQLIDALLVLAHSQRGLAHRELLDLNSITAEVVRANEAEVAARGLDLDLSLSPATLAGDPRLIERLVTNLLGNAIAHNVENGSIRLRVGTRRGQAVLTIDNTGPLVPADQVQRLLQPFQRLSPERVGGGLGLGLSIVGAIAAAHNATLEAQPGANGGLEVQVRFLPAPVRNGRLALAAPPLAPAVAVVDE
jgi:signal transduction histidine kinase